MLKIAVFGFYGLDRERITLPGVEANHLSPVTTQEFMRDVWEMEPPASRIGDTSDHVRFVKLTKVTTQPVYVQAFSDPMANDAAALNCDGYIAIIDSVKILAPKTIQNALRRLVQQHPTADVIIAAGRQNECDALSTDDIREILGLSTDLPIMPYILGEPKSVQLLIRRMVRYIDNPNRHPPAIFAGELPPVMEPPAAAAAPAKERAPRSTKPHIHGLDHVAITVADLDRSLAFYQNVLGFKLLGHLDFPGDPRGFTIAYLDTGRGLVEIFSFTQAEALPLGWTADDRQVGMRHFALRVTGLDSIAENLRNAGVTFTMPPTNANGGVRIAFFTDPDGTLIELIEGDLNYSRR